jgi:aminocarboxymuconate-semialdehyde decarboxylase
MTELGHLPVVDFHAHATPDPFKEAMARGESWHGLGPGTGELQHAGFRRSVTDRLGDMEASGVDMQVVTPNAGFYQYDKDPRITQQIARDCNEWIAELVRKHPRSFAGMGTLPMQDTDLAVQELEYAVHELGLEGAMVSDHVESHTYDEPRFLPIFQAAADLDALVFFHQGGDTCVRGRIDRYSLPNGVGNLTERTLCFGALVFGGVIDKCPGLKPLLAHGGGYVPYGAGRLDKIAGVFETASAPGRLVPPFGRKDGEYELQRPPSSYLQSFYYDCCVYDAAPLRYLVDAVGVDRVVLGSDYPAPMYLDDPAGWVEGLDALRPDEKTAILRGNAAALGIARNLS